MSTAPTTFTSTTDLNNAIDKFGLHRGYDFKGLLKSIVASLGGSSLVSSTALSATTTELNEYTLSRTIVDVSAEASYYVVAPHAGTITKIYTVVDGAVLTADVTVTAKIASTGVTDGVVTVTQSGSAAGDVDSATPSAANTVTAGQAIEFVVSGGGAAGTGPRMGLFVVISR